MEDAQHRLTQEDKSIYVVDVPNASLRSDVLHFDANGAQELGNKMFQFIEKKKLLSKYCSILATPHFTVSLDFFY